MRDLIPKLKAARRPGHRRIPARTRSCCDAGIISVHGDRAGARAVLIAPSAAAARPRAFDRIGSRRIVDRVRASGDRALLAVRAAVRRRARRRSRSARTRCASRRRGCRPTSGARFGRRRATSRASRSAQIPKHWDLEVAPGVSVEQRVEPLARVGCYVPGGRFPLPSSLLMTAVPARVAGVREIIAVCPRPEPVGDGGGARGGRHEAVSRRRRPRRRGAGLRDRTRFRAWTRSSGPATATSPPQRRWSRATAPSTSTPGPTEIVIVAGAGRPAWIAADLIAQAEHDPDARAIFITWSRRFAERVAAHGRAAAPPGATSSSSRSRPTARSSSPRSADEAMALANRIAPEHLVVDREVADAAAADRRRRLRRPVHGAGRRRLRDRIEPRAADLRRRALSRRAERRRFRARDVGAARDAAGACAPARRRSSRWRARKDSTAHAESIEVRLQ